MSVGIGTNWASRSDGNNANGAGFNPANTGMATDLVVSSGNTASPVVSSASYSFQASDVNNWLFIKSGTNTRPGWYPILSVNAGSATIDGTAGNAVQYIGSLLPIPTTWTGCTTVASTTGGTWAIDYSQNTTAILDLSDLACANSTTVTSATGSFTKAMVGNIFQIATGTNWTAGFYELATYTNSTTVVLDRKPNVGTTSPTGGVFKLGGAVAWPGIVANVAAGLDNSTSSVWNNIWIKSGSYSLTNTTAGAANGKIVSSGNAVRFIGFNNIRGDFGTRPLVTASGAISSFSMFMAGASGNASAVEFYNIELDGGSLSGISGFQATNTGLMFKCKVSNTTNAAFYAGDLGQNCKTHVVGCYALNCSNIAFYGGRFHHSLALGNGAAGSIGFYGLTGYVCYHCIAYNHPTGFNPDFGSVIAACDAINCNNGFNGGNVANIILDSVAYNNSNDLSGAILYVFNTAMRFTNNPVSFKSGIVPLASSPIVSNGSDFRLNSTANSGALCKGAALNTIADYLSASQNYGDLGALQSQATAGMQVSIY